MYFVDNGSAVPVMPQVKPVSSATPQFFTEGGNGTPPTYPGPDWFNIFQLELLNVLKEAQINPDKANHTQLVTAMKKLFLDASSNGSDIPDKAAFLSNLGLGTSAKKDIGTGSDQVPDMSSFTVTGNVNAFVMQLPGGVVIQGGKVSTDANGFATVNLGLAMSFYSVLTGESAVSNWASSGNVYSGLVIYGAQSLGATSFGFRSVWWQGADKTFRGSAATAHWIAVGRV